MRRILYFAYPANLEYSGAAVDVDESEVSKKKGCQ